MKARIEGVSQRSTISSSAPWIDIPRLCWRIVSLSSSPNAPSKRSATSPSDAVKPMPASTVAISRSISSGRRRSISSRRELPRRRMKAEGPIQPASSETTISRKLRNENLPAAPSSRIAKNPGRAIAANSRYPWTTSGSTS